MVTITLCVCSVLAVVLHVTEAQWGFRPRGWGQPTMGILRATSGAGQWRPGATQIRRRDQYQTCIGKNSNGDEMRVTFTVGDPNSEVSPWLRRWGRNPRLARQTHRLNAVVHAGQTSTLQGLFRFVVTEGSRTEEVCSMLALGRILTEDTLWGPEPVPRGVIGNTITLMPGQTATSTEILDTISFQELPGRGLALCPAHLVSGSECRGIIPLCCKIGWDQQAALEPFMQAQQGFMNNGMMGQNMIGNGMMGGQNMMGNGMMGGQNMMGNGLLGQNTMLGMSNTGGQIMGGNIQGGVSSGLIANNGLQNTGGLAF